MTNDPTDLIRAKVELLEIIAALLPQGVSVYEWASPPDPASFQVAWCNEPATESPEPEGPGYFEQLAEVARERKARKLDDLVIGDPDDPDAIWSRYAVPLSPALVAVLSQNTIEHLRIEKEQEATRHQLFLAQRMESVARLAGGVAHDFNNIVTVIQSYVGFLRASFADGDPALADLDVIEEAGERAARLTSQLLAFSRKQIMEMRLVNLNEVIADLERMLKRVLSDQLILRLSLAPKLGLVRADVTQMEQVLMNLLVNARDAMPDGGIVTIETRNAELDAVYCGMKDVSVPPGDYVCLAVTDNGPGMSPEVRNHVFDPFFTTKPPTVGTGLGLAVAYGIVKQSNGFIWAYSELGEGTTFKVYLPRAASSDQTSTVQPAIAPTELGGTETVLLVEDDIAVRKAGRRILQRKGYTVLEAADGPEALLLCERYSGEIHALLTDVVMPMMSGRELADRIRELRPTIPVMYMSGYADDAIVHHGILEGGTPFIAKPFTESSLLRTLRAALDASRS